MSVESTARRRILVLTLGGTIAMTPASVGEAGVTPQLTGADLVAAVPGLDRQAELEVEDVRQVPGASLTLADVAAVAERLAEADAAGVEGIVVTQGTDTLEETAFLLDLLYRGSTPVVLTGAMRPPQMPGADGPANLLAAVRTASCPAVRDLGVLVVFADEIHAARHVRKVHSTSTGAFVSPGTGPIGHVVEGTVRLHATPVCTVGIAARPSRQAQLRVEVLHAVLGSDGLLLDGLEDRLDGLVIAAFGAGHVPGSWVERLEQLAARIPVVLASRTGSGSVLSSTYSFPGSESDLLGRGLISGGSLDPFKARLLLWAHLAAGSDQAAIAAAFTGQH
ncbi:asparaginase [Streptomyces klenkii]|uniref:asparaginase n=1 Tax=Streptomyces klenkii TaxID=1420899 RepID=UPI0034280618